MCTCTGERLGRANRPAAKAQKTTDEEALLVQVSTAGAV